MASDEFWLVANWPFVRDSLRGAPGRVVEIGCGALGGFVPMLESAGYDVIGVDPEAPQGPCYRQLEFERFELSGHLGVRSALGYVPAILGGRRGTACRAGHP